LGPSFAGAGWQVFPESGGLLLAVLPPGAFVLFGLLLALGNARAAARQRSSVAGAAATDPAA
jgi:electron transport complex protein RnfE